MGEWGSCVGGLVVGTQLAQCCDRPPTMGDPVDTLWRSCSSGIIVKHIRVWCHSLVKIEWASLWC